MRLAKYSVLGALWLTFASQAYALSLVVSNTNATGAGSLVDAIAQVNAAGAGAHSITFSVAGTITPASTSVLEITNTTGTITIDATTAPGYTCGLPVVKVIATGFPRWRMNATIGCTIRGFVIHGGVWIRGGSGNKVEACVFNIDLNGSTAMVNPHNEAVYLDNTTTNNTVGGLTCATRNLISASSTRGIYLDGAGAGNQILGNYIGLERTGLALNGTAFSSHGIYVRNGAANTIINGNCVVKCLRGIFIDGASTGIQILNNNVGAGSNRLFNAAFTLTGTPISLDGTTMDGAIINGNVSGNTSLVGGYPTGGNIIVEDNGNDNCIIRYNYVGVDINYNKSGSAWCGIFSRGNGTTVEYNIVGDNGIRNTAQYSHGIGIEDGNNAIIRYNYVGVSPTGLDIGNGDDGIEINTADNYIISYNVIGFNRGLRASKSGGIAIVNASITGTINYNLIGVDSMGRDVGHPEYGILFLGGTSSTIANNAIAYNNLDAIHLDGGSTNDDVYITANCIWCNDGRGIEINATRNGGYGESYTTAYGAQTSVTVNAIGLGATNSDTSAATWIFRGFAPAGSEVEVFRLDRCHNCPSTGAQGQTLLGTVTTNANGLWQYTIPAGDVAHGIVATASEAGATPKRTSEFSTCLQLLRPCTPPKTLSVSPAGPLTLCVGDPLSLTAVYTLAPTTACNLGSYYYTWYKGATQVQGPFNAYTAYSLSSVVLTDAGIYKLRIEDGNAGNPLCYRESNLVTVNVNNCPLPVDWLYFKGTHQSGANVLVWAIANPINHSHFVVERSRDGILFEVLALVNGTESMTYSYTDEQVEGAYYYRLRQVDKDHKEGVSQTIFISGETSPEVRLYPIPVVQTLTLEISSPDMEYVWLEITDLQGQRIRLQALALNNGEGAYAIDLQALPAAIYVVKVWNVERNFISVQKITKVR